MPYVALYRKYRSQSFSEVVGQPHVTTVLQNALRLGRVAHAYLLCGPRGCGKTTTARLLARALNCQAADGPTPTPCGTCGLCTAIVNSTCLDVVEMDAASETGIDDVREKIIENAKYLPAEARFKVYIVDEVHDLSAKAFDSLLKTLEEPPPHVVFVLATTEAHKVPITIRSRCQRLDFRRGAMADLTANLERVLEQEGVEFEREAVVALARAAEGSFRDSLSLLEQSLAYTEGPLTAEAVNGAIGAVGPQLLDDITAVLGSNDLAAAFAKAGEVVEAGKDVKQLLVALQAHLRDLLVASIAAGPDALADVSAERFGQLKEQAAAFTAPQLLRMLDVLAASERDTRYTNQHRLLLERALWGVLPCSLAAQASPTVPAVPSAGAPAAGPSRPAPGPRQVREPASPPMPPAQASTAPPPAETPAQPALHAGGSVRAPAAPAPPSERFTDGIDLDGVRRVWPNVRRRIMARSKAAAALFGEEDVVALEGHVVVVAFPTGFALERFESPRARETMEKMLAEEVGPGYKVRCVLAGTYVHPEAIVASAPAAAQTLALDLPEPSGDAATGARAAHAAAEPARPADGPSRAGDDLFAMVMEEFDGTEVTEAPDAAGATESDEAPDATGPAVPSED